ncbi:MAG: tRNA (adenosine(37)-N6)-threonylcarbamoyltransferase complex dimerization subunit type 1 TsaB [Lachnospiraceae bacterium]|nr:tRNA (adenosine(37)-N6)-threonylcarbamoyltransferase complex dimerization subunit type 1 TsaB [Lachnospiraceae bacterium]
MILAIDSSSLVASVSLIDDTTIIAEYTINLKKTHSQTLLPMIDEIVSMTGIDKKEIEVIAVTDGPGSFTGLRIGAATAKGLAFALNIPIIGVSTIEAMAYNFNHCNKLICPIMDARRNQVYTGIYECQNEELTELMPPCAISVDELIDKIIRLEKEIIFIGDGIPVYQKYIDENLKVTHYFANNHLNRQKSSALGTLGIKYFRKGQFESADTFAPKYMRLSQAERERLEHDKADGN